MAKKKRVTVAERVGILVTSLDEAPSISGRLGHAMALAMVRKMQTALVVTLT